MPGTAFGFRTERGNVCTTPANFHLLIERKHDSTMTNPGYRWWSEPGRLSPAPHEWTR
jgi:hypothetical protein